MKNIITFDNSLKNQILNYFNKSTNEEHFIVEKDNPLQQVIASDGESIKSKEFAGIRKGSEVFIRSDFNSLINLVDSLEKD